MAYTPNNLIQLFRLIGSFPGQECSELSGCLYVRSQASAWPNQIYALSPARMEVDQLIRGIEDKVVNGDLPNLLTLHATPTLLPVIYQLKTRGYASTLWTAMTHPLKQLEHQLPPPGLQVSVVQDEGDLVLWLSIVEMALMGNQPLNADVFRRLLAHPNSYFYLGNFAGHAVATALLFVHGKSAGFYLVATHRDYRKRGYGSELTRRCLLKAQSLDCTKVNIQATTLGKGVYQKLGFQAAGEVQVFRIKRSLDA